MISLERKHALRERDAGRRAADAAAAALSRTGQVSRSSISVGDDEVPIDAVLTGAVDDSTTVAEQVEAVAFLDDDQVDSFDTIIEAGGAADIDSVLDAQEAEPDLGDEWEANAAADEEAHSARLAGADTALDVVEAQKAADQALADALLAKITADGKNTIYAGMTEPVAEPDEPFAQGDLWYVTDVEGRLTMVRIWNGNIWAGYQFVADSVLVPGSVGPTVIKDGAITTVKLAATAIDGMVITGATIRTAAAGQRLQLDAFGLRAFNAQGAVTASLASASGGFDLTGWIRAGVGGSDPFEVYIEPGYLRSQGAEKATSGGLLYNGSGKVEIIRGSLRASFTGAHPEAGTLSQSSSLTAYGLQTENIDANNARDLTLSTASNRSVIFDTAAIRSTRTSRLLWSGAFYMHGTQSITFAELANLQLNGIELLFSSYDRTAGSANNWHYHSFLVPKSLIIASAYTGFNTFNLANGGRKLLYLTNTGITGHGDNDKAPNNDWVLRAVWGI